MTAEATSSDQRWMRSGQYDETVYMPVSWVVVPGDNTWGNSNSGLAEGRLAAKNVEITGATIDDLTVTVTLNFTASVSGTQPTYRVMLMGRYLGDRGRHAERRKCLSQRPVHHAGCTPERCAQQQHYFYLQ